LDFSIAIMQRSIDRSATYNNAGVRLMTAGNHNAALELFRGALESKLSFERRAFSGRDDASIERCVTPDMSDTEVSPSSSSSSRSDNEDLPTTTLDTYLELSRSTEVGPQHLPRQSPQFVTFNDGVTMMISMPSATSNSGGGGCEPFLYTKPFAVPEETNGSVSQCTTQATSCRIVFNLALIHQLVCRSSAKAASFYEIAATLLSSLPDEQDDEIFVLRLVLLNNFGVWCFENAEGESMMACFEQLVETLQNEDEMSSLSIDPSILHGIQRNIQAFLTPMNGVSLAA
jgi:hypothetical protein